MPRKRRDPISKILGSPKFLYGYITVILFLALILYTAGYYETMLLG